MFNFHLSAIRVNYPYLTMREAVTLASLQTIIDGYPGPVIGSDEDIASVLAKIESQVRSNSGFGDLSESENLQRLRTYGW
jgi:hypothetical protein